MAGDTSRARRLTWSVAALTAAVACGAMLAASRTAPRSALVSPEAETIEGNSGNMGVAVVTKSEIVAAPIVKARHSHRHSSKIMGPTQTVVITATAFVRQPDMRESDAPIEVILSDYPARFPPQQVVCKQEAPGESGIALAWTRNLRLQEESEEDCVSVERD